MVIREKEKKRLKHGRLEEVLDLRIAVRQTKPFRRFGNETIDTARLQRQCREHASATAQQLCQCEKTWGDVQRHAPRAAP
jgi:hypothetical protein